MAMRRFLLTTLLLCITCEWVQAQTGVRLKDLARIEGVRSNALVGYGLVVGLAGTGDSRRNRATIQSIANTLVNFGVNVGARDVNSRNVAAVMITATLPPFSEKGDTIDINVSSSGDAKSLAGGTLLMVPLKAANNQVYALAQGQISVGGYKFDAFGNVLQKNHPTVGTVPQGATIERKTFDSYVNAKGEINVILNKPDFTTMNNIVDSLYQTLPGLRIEPVHAGKVTISVKSVDNRNIFRLISTIEGTLVYPDTVSRIVINERTGTIVAGGDIKISGVTISHGDLRLEIKANYDVSQPFLIGSSSNENIQTTVVPNADIKVTEGVSNTVSLGEGTSITDLIAALRKIKLSTRDMITILQSIKGAGALHADLIIQ